MLPERFTKNIRYLRKLMNLTQEEFGKFLKASRATITNWETGEVKYIPDDKATLIFENLSKYPNFPEISIEEFLTEDLAVTCVGIMQHPETTLARDSEKKTSSNTDPGQIAVSETAVVETLAKHSDIPDELFYEESDVLTAKQLNRYIANNWERLNLDREDVEHLRTLMFRANKKFLSMSDQKWDQFWDFQLKYFRENLK